MSGADPRLGERIVSVQQLSSVVASMRGIAAARAAQSRRQLQGIQAYAAIVADALSECLSMLDDGAGALPRSGRAEAPRACLCFCAEQGFVGAFNEHLVDEALPLGRAGSPLWVVGTRGTRLFAARGVPAQWSTAMIAQTGHVTALAQRVGRQIEDALRTGQVSGVELIHAEPVGSGSTRVVRHSLLPLDAETFRRGHLSQPPLTNLPPDELFEQFAREYVFAQLCAAALTHHAAENTARMQAMASAQDNIAETLESLQQQARMARQDQITDEIIELAAGMQALSGQAPSTG